MSSNEADAAPHYGPSLRARYRRWMVAASLLSRLDEWSGHKEAEMAEHNTAALVLFDDPVEITERVAVAAFLAGYTGP